MKLPMPVMMPPPPLEEDHLCGSLFGQKRSRYLPTRGKSLSRDYLVSMFALDCLAITVLFAASVWMRYGEGLVHAWSWRVYTVLLVTCCSGLYMIGGYRQRTIKRSVSYATEHLLVSFGIFSVSFITLYAFIAYGQHMRAARTSVGVVLIGFSVISLFYRRLLDPYFRHAMTERRIDIIGAGSLANQLYYRLREKCWGYTIRVFDEDRSLVGQRIESEEEDPPLIEDAALLPELSLAERAKNEAVILTTPPSQLSSELRQHLLNAQYLNGLQVHTYDSYVRSHFATVPVESLSHDWAFTEGSKLSHSPGFEQMKRCMDLAVCVLLLVILAPLMFRAPDLPGNGHDTIL